MLGRCHIVNKLIDSTIMLHGNWPAENAIEPDIDLAKNLSFGADNLTQQTANMYLAAPAAHLDSD
jgi:hypothetical protein